MQLRIAWQYRRYIKSKQKAVAAGSSSSSSRYSCQDPTCPSITLLHFAVTSTWHNLLLNGWTSSTCSSYSAMPQQVSILSDSVHVAITKLDQSPTPHAHITSPSTSAAYLQACTHVMSLSTGFRYCVTLITGVLAAARAAGRPSQAVQPWAVSENGVTILT